MFEKKEVAKIDWGKRRQVINEIASLTEEKEKSLRPLQKLYDELMERETMLHRTREKISTLTRDFNKKMFNLQKVLKAEAPKEINELIEKFNLLLSDLYTPKHIKVENIYNPRTGRIAHSDNLQGISQAKKILEAGIIELEALKLKVTSEDELIHTLDKIEKRIEAEVEKAKKEMVKVIMGPPPPDIMRMYRGTK